MNSTVVYPPSPKNVDTKITEPSTAFKKEVLNVLGAILFFIATYFVLMAAAIMLAILCGYGGIMLIAIFPRFITLMLGLGLIGLGCMVIFFLLKFLFKSNTVDRSNLTQITEEDQPQLFAFIRTLTKETQAPFPKKIYVSADVNASVFYDSGFWSMFLPVRKNLQIGLGLVNAVNVSEFKAILAHEFGHFSQKSMKLGSYVYNVNKVIYNMLYDNEGYGNTLQSWANISGYFAFFAGLTAGIVTGIQKILQKVYAVINKRYMALSRQMEFHADAVAASVSGSSPLVTSLRRLEVADTCYNQVLNYYGRWYKQNLKGDNLYQHHEEVMKHFAQDHGLKIENGGIKVTATSFSQYNRARVVVKDQWASHPSTDDREAHLNKLNIEAELIITPAWTLFSDAEKLQQEITNQVYSAVKFDGTPEPVTLEGFKSRYLAQVEKYKIDKRYKGFYDDHDIARFDVDQLTHENIEADSLDEVLTDTVLSYPYSISGLQHDIYMLGEIRKNTDGINTFEFNGEKYDKEDAVVVLGKIEDELKETIKALEIADKNLFLFFLKKANLQHASDHLISNYKKLFELRTVNDANLKKYHSLMNEVSQIYHQTVTIEAAYAITNNMKREEIEIKDRIKEMLSSEGYATYYTEDEKKKLELYTSRSYEYFTQPNFNTEALTLFNEAMTIYGTILADSAFDLKKKLLTEQLSLL